MKKTICVVAAALFSLGCVPEEEDEFMPAISITNDTEYDVVVTFVFEEGTMSILTNRWSSFAGQIANIPHDRFTDDKGPPDFAYGRTLWQADWVSGGAESPCGVPACNIDAGSIVTSAGLTAAFTIDNALQIPENSMR